MENPDVDALLALLKGRYGGRLTNEQLEELRKAVEAASERAAQMRSVPLGNGDEPAFVFRPFRAED